MASAKHIAIIGAGPAGLTAAYLLAKENISVTVFEADPQYVGGIARTGSYKGYCYDIGGHRFFSKSQEIEALWAEMLPNDMLVRERSSRIFYNKHYFSYPLKALDALRKLGIIESIHCVLSYLKARVFPIANPKSFSDWVTNHFGKRLYSIFFKTYTEKVWGMSCDNISADWAAQRIKGLSLKSAILNAFFPQKKNKKVIKTLIDSFRYPRKGPGMLWEACADKIKQGGGEVLLGCKVKQLEFDAKLNEWRVSYQDINGQLHNMNATQVISSAPLKELVLDYLSPPLPSQVLSAANQLQYRDFMIVVLILKESLSFSDNWIYIHDPHVDVGRIQNFKSWSPEMVPDPTMSCYGMEYFCFSDDQLWSACDPDLIKKASLELISLGLAKQEDIVDGYVVRQSKAYPVYDHYYQDHVETIRRDLEDRFPALYLVGRNGMHKYNNQDHAMMTAILTVKNILANKRCYDVWCVNQDAEYIESVSLNDKQMEFGLRQVPLPKVE
jgi:protoporphyrinogen oxidase